MSDIVTQPWVFALAAGFVGLSLGAWGNHLSNSNVEPLPKLDTTSLWNSVTNAKRNLDEFINLPQGQQRPKVPVKNPMLKTESLAQVRSTLASLKSWGVPIPNADNVDVTHARVLRDYFSSLQPFISANQKAEAKLEAQRFLVVQSNNSDNT